ncbi:hypothetical protein P154DRAFT_589006 [Amniculicola lignicola CBS 123094]|uniref:Uncharacterized protein n=1 Tax=Amniculicola lignicola CBS 123094 TaxID=1392246 RepID=A0A6A5VXE5_9PLEO|nr:hypothetical protein P154DRAFT_589006 [Amniculicola lignicola CBS 123094]
MSASDSGNPSGNWFLESDGTCGDPSDSSLASQASFIGFLVLSIVVALITGFLNFWSLDVHVREGHLFKHPVYRQAVIGVFASIIAPILAATLFKQDKDTYTWHNFHIVMWTVFFGYHPGAYMGLTQIFRKKLSSAASAGQMIADMIFPIVGCAVALGSEGGSVVPVAYGQYRTTVFIGVSLLVVHILLLLVIYFAYWPSSGETNCLIKYHVFISTTGRLYVFFLGLLSFCGSTILLIVGSKSCGKMITFIEAMCLILQAILMFFLAVWERS